MIDSKSINYTTSNTTQYYLYKYNGLLQKIGIKLGVDNYKYYTSTIAEQNVIFKIYHMLDNYYTLIPFHDIYIYKT